MCKCPVGGKGRRNGAKAHVRAGGRGEPGEFGKARTFWEDG